jgi:hypothetical protein
MLSAGNLNTAALTLFLALHLAVTLQLPWLMILDDPVQSMDEAHISHFAALSRTLSKEHGRKIVMAVHERQLFDYLELELSPAFKVDQLITVEITRYFPDLRSALRSRRRDYLKCIALEIINAGRASHFGLPSEDLEQT